MLELAEVGRRMKEEVKQQDSGSPKFPLHFREHLLDSEHLLCGREWLSMSPTDKETDSQRFNDSTKASKEIAEL